MTETRWHIDPEAGFRVRLPAGWEAEPDPDDGGLDIYHPEGPGELHLLAFPPAGNEPPDAAEELYSFLQENEIELEEDEIGEVDLEEGGSLASCQYLSEDEEEDETSFWLVGVGTLPTATVFAHYTCLAGEEEGELDRVLSILQSLRSAEP